MIPDLAAPLGVAFKQSERVTLLNVKPNLKANLAHFR